MLHLHYSNRFEDLISPLRTAVRIAQRKAPLERVTIVVPNRAVDEYIKLRLAEREGIAANLYCPFLRRYLGEVIQKAVGDLRILDLKELQIVIFEFLRKAAASEDSDFDAIRSYIGTSHARPRQSDLRLFQLSERVAWLFREYSILRGAMLKRWSAGPTRIPDSADSSEVWQRRIWTALFNPDGALKASWMTADRSNPNRRWMMLPDAIAALDSEQLRSALPAQLHIFGLSYVGAEFLRIFGPTGVPHRPPGLYVESLPGILGRRFRPARNYTKISSSAQSRQSGTGPVRRSLQVRIVRGTISRYGIGAAPGENISGFSTRSRTATSNPISRVRSDTQNPILCWLLYRTQFFYAARNYFAG